MNEKVAGGGPGKLDPIERVEVAISYLLRIGVLTSMAIVLLGMTLTFARHPDYLHDPKGLEDIKAARTMFPRTLAEEVTGVAHGRGSALVVLGLVVLIATPVLRVALSVLVFAYERDGLFMAMTALVLALLLISFVMGRAHLVPGE